MDLQGPLARRVQHQVMTQRWGEKILVCATPLCAAVPFTTDSATRGVWQYFKCGDQGAAGSMGGTTTKIKISSIISWTTTNSNWCSGCPIALEVLGTHGYHPRLILSGILPSATPPPMEGRRIRRGCAAIG